MFKILSLIFIFTAYLFVFFLPYKSANAALCSYEIATPAPFRVGSTITIRITGGNNLFYAAGVTTVAPDGTEIPASEFETTFIESDNTGQITLQLPNSAGDYKLGVWEWDTQVSNVINRCGSETINLITDVSQCSGFLGCLSSVQVPGLKFTNQSTFIGDLVSNILPIILAFSGFVSVIIIVISGIQFVTSSGNPEAAAAARNRLIFALVGFVIIILAFAITQIVDRIFLGGSGVV